MQVKIGDKVKFLNDVGGGKVTRIIDKKTVGVLNQDGFEVPVLIKELIKIDDAEMISGKTEMQAPPKKQVSPKKEEIEEPEPEIDFEDDYKKDDDELCIYLAFVPKDEKHPVNGELDLYIINDSNYRLFYNIGMPVKQNENSIANGIIQPNLKEKLTGISKETVNSFTKIHVQAIAFKDDVYRQQAVIEEIKDINPVKFYKFRTFKENDFFDENAYILTVFEESKMASGITAITDKDLKKAFVQKEIDNKRLNKPKTFKKIDKPEEEIVDLHIHELIEDEKELSNKEMLDIQIDIFNRKMKDAIDKKLKRIVFIHGVGNGKLKTEVRRELDRSYKKYTYQDASFREYGWGATLVFLTQKA